MFRYVRIQDGSPLPDITDLEPFKAIVVIEDRVAGEWQKAVSTWLVRSGCLFMMAWGDDCSSWDDSVDYANLEEFDFGEIPEDQVVMTTWHDSQTLPEVFEFAKVHARHPLVTLSNVLVVHLGTEDRHAEFCAFLDPA